MYRLKPFQGEDYEFFYGRLNYEGKRVLDIGADYGSTADFFLLRGARDIVAVEPDPRYYIKLEENAKNILGIIPVKMAVTSSDDLEYLYIRYKPEIVKMDCEGCEMYALTLSNEVFSIPETYVVETHTNFLTQQWTEKLVDADYEIIYSDNWIKAVSVIAAQHQRLKK